MTPTEASRHFAKVQKTFVKNLVVAESQSVKEAQRQAIVFSSGTITTATLRAAGHPFAVRAPNSAYNPSLINTQGGLFAASWRGIAPVVSPGNIVSSVVNIDPKSIFMMGTRLMVKRPIGDKVKNAVQPRRLARIRKAVQSAWLSP
jgi:hypothetical protein